ncbi:unnamed protein product [Moneuplotes crassus]|uniref:Uncharacterized protein n=1 Tax=Euplotes crassus TaxID=5936 RepID=A0AAD2CXI6_EUPCR|nr:unnamed protein product [Moneuplotes crassus]
MPNCYLKTLKWSYKRVKNRDIFKQSISLNYRGNDTFSNFIGGIATLIIFVILAGYSIIFFRIMINRSDVSWNLNSVRTNLATEHEPLVWAEDDPKLKIYWTAYQHHLLDNVGDPENALKFSFSHEYINTEKKANGDDYYTRTELSYEPCADDFWTNQDLDNKLNIIKPHCPNIVGQKLNGNQQNNKEYSYVTFWYSNCRYESNCVHSDISKEIINKSIISVHVKNKYVDLNDIENPIKDYTETLRNIQIKTGIRTRVTMKLRKHEVVLDDSLFPLPWSTEPIYFNSLEDYSIYEEMPIVGDSDGEVVFEIVKDDRIDQHHRKLLNFLEVTGILGGMFEVFEVGFGAIIGIYASFIFKKRLGMDVKLYEAKFETISKEMKELEKRLKENKQQEEEELNQDEEEKEGGNLEKITEESKSKSSKISRKEESKLANNIARISSNQADLNNSYGPLNLNPDLPVEPGSLFMNPQQNAHEPSKIPAEIDAKQDEKKCCFFNKFSTNDQEVENFNDMLDCFYIVYMMKKLQIQIKYILSRDSEYQEALEKNPSLDLDPRDFLKESPSSQIHPVYGQNIYQIPPEQLMRVLPREENRFLKYLPKSPENP